MYPSERLFAAMSSHCAAFSSCRVYGMSMFTMCAELNNRVRVVLQAEDVGYRCGVA